MINTKSAKSVIEAIKSRGDVGGAKKGVKLLGIVQKLSKKRKAMKADAEEKGEVEDKKESKAMEESEKDE